MCDYSQNYVFLSFEKECDYSHNYVFLSFDKECDYSHTFYCVFRKILYSMWKYSFQKLTIVTIIQHFYPSVSSLADYSHTIFGVFKNLGKIVTIVKLSQYFWDLKNGSIFYSMLNFKF